MKSEVLTPADIISIQRSITDAKDFIAANSDADESGVGEKTLKALTDSYNKLDAHKQVLYVRAATRKLRNNKMGL